MLVELRGPFFMPKQDTSSPFTVLKGPKLEIFGFRVFTQFRPVGDLGTWQKNSKF
jgi:hypothetical protein